MTFKKGETDVPENIHGVSLNKEVEKERKRRMFFTIYIFDKRNDSLQNNHQISFNKEKIGASATKCFPLSSIFTKESIKIKKNTQFKSKKVPRKSISQTKKKMI